jgi:phenylpropionate dioxygenase-like ring-hydroxylating dioxygenase large terminal subunit
MRAFLKALRGLSLTSMDLLSDTPTAAREPGLDHRDVLDGLWYAAGPSAAFKAGKAFHRQALGRPWVMGRSAAGEAFVLEDLCPHRGALLSAGAFDGRELECPFHGWRFDTAGACTLVPSMPSDRPLDLSKINVRALETREAMGIVWMRAPGGPPNAPAEPSMVEEFKDAKPKATVELIFETDQDNAVFGLLDPAHGPYVHQSRLWRSPGNLKDKEKAFEPEDQGFTMVRHAPSSNSFIYKLLGGDRTTEIRFQLPGWRAEHIRTGAHSIVNLTTITPMTARTCRVTNLLYWTQGWLDVFQPMLKLLARRFLGQDQAIIAIQNQGLQFDPKMMLVLDADAQQRWYSSLKRQWRQASEAGTPFQNTVKPAKLRWRT